MCSFNQNAFAFFLTLSIFVILTTDSQNEFFRDRRKLSSEHKAYKAIISPVLGSASAHLLPAFPVTAPFPLLQQPQGRPPPYHTALLFQFTHLHLSMTESSCEAQDYTSCPYCNKNTVPATWYCGKACEQLLKDGTLQFPGFLYQVVSPNLSREEDTGFLSTI